jgi:carbon-monoxide dehydrogenase medium subunit
MHQAAAGLIATASRTAPPCPVFRPTAIEAALAVLRDAPLPPTLVAGGTDLCAQFNEGLEPTALLALDRIDALRTITTNGQTLWIGSAVTHAQGCTNELVRTHLPGFAEAWRRIANVRVRVWATIGGNLMARRPRYEMSLLLTALGAQLEFSRTTGAIATLTPADLWTNAVPPRALLTRIGIPLHPSLTFIYDRTLRPITTLALSTHSAGATAVIATERLPPWSVAVPPGPPEAAAAAAFATLPASFDEPGASHWYLRRAGETLLRRALQKAAAHV